MKRHKNPPRWLLAFWTLIVIGIVTLRWVVDLGDVGMGNVFTYMLLFLAGVVGLFWWIFRADRPLKVRLGVVAGLAVAWFAFTNIVEFRGWSGEMVPMFGLPGGDTPEAGAAEGSGSAVDLASTTPYDYNGYLGSNRDLQAPGVILARDWEAQPPELLWQQPIGLGWSSFAVVNGYAATLEEREGRELVTLYEVQTGDLIWATEIGGAYNHMLGGAGPRSTPLIHEGIVYAMGVNGHLVALDGATGAIIWERDILQDYGISTAEEFANIAYGRPTSPLVIGDKLILGVGGSAANRVSVVAYEKRHGEVLWESGNHNVSMASPGHGVLAGVEQILMVNENFVTGHDVETGQQLWEFAWPGMTAADSNVSQAIAIAPDKVFVSKGYGSGAAVHQIVPNGDGTFSTEELWHSARVLRTKLTNVAIRDGHAYGLSEGVLECVDLETGERVWKAGRYRHGQILMAADLLLVLGEDGGLFLVEATPESRNTVLGEIQAIEGHTWNNFALYGDVVLVRNGQQAAAYRLPLDLPLVTPMATPEPEVMSSF